LFYTTISPEITEVVLECIYLMTEWLSAYSFESALVHRRTDKKGV
jgi:hypothetical protein